MNEIQRIDKILKKEAIKYIRNHKPKNGYFNRQNYYDSEEISRRYKDQKARLNTYLINETSKVNTFIGERNINKTECNNIIKDQAVIQMIKCRRNGKNVHTTMNSIDREYDKQNNKYKKVYRL